MGSPKSIQQKDYELYREFWQSNLQIVQQISKELERSLIDMEKKSLDFDSSYAEINSKLETLHAIYRSYATMEGDEYILKLKALINDHRREFERQKVSFNVIHFLLDKIRQYEFDKIKKFPAVERAAQEITPKAIPITLAEDAPFKWITFLRNGSWFIAPYTTAEILPAGKARYEKNSNLQQNRIVHNKKIFTVTDLFISAEDGPPPSPISYIILNGNTSLCFAADRTGKRVIAKKNLLASKIEPLKKKSSRAEGFVRIAGTRYIYLTL